MKAFILIANMSPFILAGIAIVIIISYNKGNVLSPEIFGKWEVREQYGGNILPADSVYKPGNGNILQFSNDSTYKRYAQGKLTAEGVFRIRKNGYMIDRNFYNELYFDNDTTFKSLISLTGDKLIIKPLIPDISTTDYQKIQD